MDSPIIIGGDFNMISNLEAKKGCLRSLSGEDEAFNSMITACEMVDIQTSSGFFTWNNRRGGPHQIAKRLDRFVVSKSILTMGGLLNAMVLPMAGSYHWPIALSWHSKGQSLHKPFRFENFWIIHPTFLDSISLWWKSMKVNGRSKMGIMHKKLKQLRSHLCQWNHSTFGNIFEDKKAIHESLETLQICAMEQDTARIPKSRKGISLLN